jgi:hypothetical protein
MRQAPHPPPPETDVRAAWPALFAAAGQTPGLWPERGRHRDDLLPRVAAYYTELQALPRRVRRALQRQLGLPLATLALWLALGQLPTLAATITVGGPCTLVDAITAANTNAATGGCPAGSGADTIVLPPGSTQTLTQVNNDTYGATGLPVVSSVITIAGQGSTIARASGAPAFRLLAVHRTGDLTLQETTVSGGTSTDFLGGGGVANFGGTLAITNSTIAGNTTTAQYGGGVANFSYFGYFNGGTNYYGKTVITDSIISGNSGSSFGGGVGNLASTLTITNSTVSGNTASEGGGVANRDGRVYDFSVGGTLTITDSTIAGNTASSRGGGVDNFGPGSTLITNSTISGNTAGVGGGVANNYTFYPATLTIANSTIAGNTADTRGGGLENYRSDLTLIRTLISGSTAPVTPEIFNDGAVVADSHNLFGVDGEAGVVGFSPGPTDVVPPRGVRLRNILEPTLALHGGRTQTLALVPGSPAVDAGGPVCLDAQGKPLLTDQRGQPRPVDGNRDGTAACDIGAFEFFPIVNAFVTLDPALDTASDPTPVPGGPAGTFTVTATFTNTSETPLRFPFFEVTALSGGNLLLNADEEPGGVGATLTPAVADRVLAPDETVVVDFVIGLQARARFTFFVDLFGEPIEDAAEAPGTVRKLIVVSNRSAGEPSRPLESDTAREPLGRRAGDALTAGAPARPQPFRFEFDPAAGVHGR